MFHNSNFSFKLYKIKCNKVKVSKRIKIIIKLSFVCAIHHGPVLVLSIDDLRF